MDYHDDDEFDDDDEFETRIRNLAHPQNVGLLEKRICNLEKRIEALNHKLDCLLYTSPSPRDRTRSRMPSSA